MSQPNETMTKLDRLQAKHMRKMELKARSRKQIPIILPSSEERKAKLLETQGDRYMITLRSERNLKYWKRKNGKI